MAGDDTQVPQILPHGGPGDVSKSTHAASTPLHTTSPSQKVSTATISTQVPAARSISMVMGNGSNQGEESPVMNETLSVIDEHITDMNTPRSSLLAADRRCTNDSGSEYSSHIGHRISYINGHETDEEERNTPLDSDVLKWTSAQVSQKLKEIGVETRHCEIFREQEISGEVLLGMDQASVFMKEFDLGLVGRRLRTWHKIKTLQEEIRGRRDQVTPGINQDGVDSSSDDMERDFSRSSMSNSILPRIPSLVDRQNSISRTSQPESGRVQSHPSQLQVPLHHFSSTGPNFSAIPGSDSSSRPSAASIRDLNQSRRHSSADFTSNLGIESSIGRTGTASPSTRSTAHRKIPSFDRNWTMGGPIPTGHTTVPSSPIGMSITSGHAPASTDRNTFVPSQHDSGLHIDTMQDLDRGYASGGDVENRKSRNVLRKRDVISASHSRQNSNNVSERRKSVTGRRHSRFGSADSIRDTVAAVTVPATKFYHNNSLKGRFRSPSARDSGSPVGSLIQASSPIITKPSNSETPGTSFFTPSPKSDSGSTSAANSPRPHQSSHFSRKPRMSLRAISDSITGSEKSLITSPTSLPSPVKESPLQSRSRSGSTTTSGASKSLELVTNDVSSKNASYLNNGPTNAIAAAIASRRKSKKETSAYTRGLEKKRPHEQMQGCDYSGWMKKKSPNLMTTWKPRLFVLRGRRLSYYYTEQDTEERGLIDISSHRVLPADNDRLTGLHATVTGAKSSPTSPANAQTETQNSVEAAAQVQFNLSNFASNTIPEDNSMFIFKLVPPRAGLSRAVNFTKPTVHYFATDNLKQGRLWMAALMKATIERDDQKPVSSTYQQKTISLAKAKAMRHRPPALMNLDDGADVKDERVDALRSKSEGAETTTISPTTEAENDDDGEVADEDINGFGAGLNILGLDLRTDQEMHGEGEPVGRKESVELEQHRCTSPAVTAIETKAGGERIIS